MFCNQETGKLGEMLATKWLRTEGYSIITTNWRWHPYEIDIIAERQGKLHLIEVKTRKGDKYGLPEEAVSKKKIKSLMKAAARYSELHPEYKRIQIDILAINLQNIQDPVFFLIEDIYFF
ncbi:MULTISPECIES: YraN family protein [unclassified Paraflavitalea]|uniref:YraN family protein n=1 Tax=unclassified Paraflavitalea TaxID=2798305 RepID=UPI003D32E9A6